MNDLIKKPRKLNALKHGLLSQNGLLAPDELRPFNKLNRLLLAQLNPSSPIEIMLAEQIIWQYWRLRRFLKIENDVLIFAGSQKYPRDSQRDFIPILTDFLKENPSLELLSRYNTSILRSFYRALHEYQQLKKQTDSMDLKESE